MSSNYIIVLSLVVYSIVNAAFCAIFFPQCTGVSRKALYFKQFFWFNVMTVVSVLGAQLLFLMYQCRLGFLLYKYFHLFSPACLDIPKEQFLAHQDLFVMISFYLITTIINYYFVKHEYDISSDKVKIMIAVSNIIACGAKYAFTANLL